MVISLRSISRSAVAKAVSFIVFIGCAAAIVSMSIHLFDNWSDVYPSDHFMELPFDSSDYIQTQVSRRVGLVLNASGWYAESQAYADELHTQCINELLESEGFLYRAETPFYAIENTNMDEDEFKRHGIWVLQSGSTTQNSGFFNRRYYHTPFPSRYYELSFCMTDELIERLKDTYYSFRSVFWKFAKLYALAGFGLLLSLLHLLLVCGRRKASALPDISEEVPVNTVHISPFWDKPQLDVSLCAVILLYALAALTVDNYFLGTRTLPPDKRVLYGGVATAALAAISLWWVLCAVKRVKNRSFLKHTFIYAVMAFTFKFLLRFTLRPTARFFRFALNALPLTALTGLYVVGFSFIFFLFGCALGPEPAMVIVYLLFMCAAGTYFIWKTIHLNNIARGLEHLAKGDYQTPLEERGRGTLLKMAQNVNAATDGLKAAVEKEMQSQRFKNELITNVSHDLRTPLTSVITYADLLQSEGFSSPDAAQYLEVIRQKARRLQTLTDDLFEASKAAAGETKAALVSIDLGQLIEQALGEMDERLRAVPLDVRVSGKCGAVIADGRMLHRVFENLLRNIEKYAMPGTRVYIDTISESGFASVTLRNISAAPPATDAERLTERFTRGDEARSTEGSGLGLAIVKSFMQLQKGSFSLVTDGDLFKVTLSLPLAELP